MPRDVAFAVSRCARDDDSEDAFVAGGVGGAGGGGGDGGGASPSCKTTTSNTASGCPDVSHVAQLAKWFAANLDVVVGTFLFIFVFPFLFLFFYSGGERTSNRRASKRRVYAT